MGVVKKAVGGIGDIVSKAAPLANFIPGVGPVASGVIGALGGAAGTLNDENQAVTDFLRNAGLGGAGGVGGALLGGATGLSGILGGAFDPTQRVVSGVPDELKTALANAGVNINDLIEAGGGLPQFDGAYGTAPNAEQLAASEQLQQLIGTAPTGPDLGTFNSILGQLQDVGTGDLTATNEIINQLRSSGADLGTVNNLISQVQGLQGPEFGDARSLISALNAGGPDTVNTTALLNRLATFQGADVSGVNDVIRQLQTAPAPGTTAATNLLQQIQGIRGPELGSAEEIISALRGITPDTTAATGAASRLEGLPGPDLLKAENLATRLTDLQGPDVTEAQQAARALTSLAGPDTGRAASLLDRVEGLATGPEQQRLLDTLLPTLEQAAAAKSFDLTDLFKAGEETFQGDLEKQIADIKAESSALGLGAGSSDRNRRLLETAAQELSRFRLGQEDVARQSFESAENRRIGAINAGGAVSEAVGRPSSTLADIVPAAIEEGSRGAEFTQQGLAAALPTLLESGRLPAEFTQQGLAAALPALIETGRLPAEFAQQGLTAALPTLLEAGISPAQIQATALSSALPGALETGTQGADFALRQLATGLPTALETDLRPEELRQQGLISSLSAAISAAGLGSGQELQALIASLPTALQAELDPSRIAQAGQAAALPAALQIGQAGADYDLQKLLGTLNPAVQAALGAGGLQQTGLAAALPTAYQAGIYGDQALTDRLLSTLNPALEAGQVGANFDLAQRAQQASDISSLFGFGTTQRGFGESEIDRLLSEFARTQTGGYDLLTKLLAATPESTTAFGPSTASQVGTLAEGASKIIPAVQNLFKGGPEDAANIGSGAFNFPKFGFNNQPIDTGPPPDFFESPFGSAGSTGGTGSSGGISSNIPSFESAAGGGPGGDFAFIQPDKKKKTVSGLPDFASYY